MKREHLLSILSSLGQNQTDALLGLAEQALASFDGRQLSAAIEHFAAAGEVDRLVDLLELARSYGDIRAVARLRQMGQELGLLVLSVPDFGDWLKQQGMPRFDSYHDSESGISFIPEADAAYLQSVVAEEFEDVQAFWGEVLTSLEQVPSYPNVRLELLRQLSEGVAEPAFLTEKSVRTVDEDFQAYCRENGIQILRQLQVGGGFDTRSSVYLVLDADGIAKVYKEILKPRFGLLETLTYDESVVYEHVAGLSFLPQFYGVTHIGNATFMRLEVVYGQSLVDYAHAENHLNVEEAVSVVGQLAAMLASLHERGVLYMDMRPENVKINGREVHLLDFGDSRLAQPGVEVPTHVHDVRYVAPETVLRARASRASDVFQLGVLFHEVLTGEHPFVCEAVRKKDTTEEDLVRYGVASVAIPLKRDLANEFNDSRLHILHRMLAKNPKDRPSAREVAMFLQTNNPEHFAHRRRSAIPDANGTVIFPARMGIPHRGHIDFMARILELGFKLVVSLHASYVQTSIDPLPKWFVAKMVASALKKKGFDPSQVRFLFTPLFESPQGQKWHYAMMPGVKEVVAVASGNTDTHAFFSDRPIIDQRTVFGNEGQDFETRSWGERLRRAVRENDVETFNDLIAPGAIDILFLEEMQQYCAVSETPVIYSRGSEHWGNLYVVLSQPGQGEILRQRVNAYSGPESTLVNALSDTHFIDPFTRDALVSVSGTPMRLHYERIEIDSKKNLIIHYQLLER